MINMRVRWPGEIVVGAVLDTNVFLILEIGVGLDDE